MDKIRIDFFDILGYLVPGSVLLMVLWIGVDTRVACISDIPDLLSKVDQKGLLFSLFPAYITGFMLHAFGSSLYDLYAHKKIGKNSPGKVQDDWAYIREYGGKHISILERWYALRAFSQNLAAVGLIAGLFSLAKWWHAGYSEWFIVFAFSIGLCWMALKRSAIFDRFLSEDIAAVLRLNLKDRKGII